MELILYEKPRCHLCHDAADVIADVLESLDGAVPVEWRRIEITHDSQLFARYRHDVPVIALDGRELFRHRVTPGALHDALVQAGAPR